MQFYVCIIFQIIYLEILSGARRAVKFSVFCVVLTAWYLKTQCSSCYVRKQFLLMTVDELKSGLLVWAVLGTEIYLQEGNLGGKKIISLYRPIMQFLFEWMYIISKIN